MDLELKLKSKETIFTLVLNGQVMLGIFFSIPPLLMITAVN